MSPIVAAGNLRYPIVSPGEAVAQPSGVMDTSTVQRPCSHSQQELADLCNNAYPACKGTCDGEMG